MPKIARIPLFGLVVVAGLALIGRPAPADPACLVTPSRTVYLAKGLRDEQLIALGAAVAARPGALLLVDSPGVTDSLRQFLSAYEADKVVPIGPWDSPICPLWDDPSASLTRLIVCPAGRRDLLLRAAHLAACERSPLWVVHDGDALGPLRRFIRSRGIREVVRVGADVPAFKGVKNVPLADVDAVEAATRRVLGTATLAVIANPADTGRGGMAALAPWLAGTRRAALLLTNDKGSDVAELVEATGKQKAFRDLDTLLILADLQAIPVWRRPNPIPGDKDPHIEMEPCTPTGQSPFSYATGRLFHEDRAVVPLMLARQRLAAERPKARRALVASNPGGGLPLLEAFSRNTQRELANVGYQVTGLYGKSLDGPTLREQMPRHDVILWEGHHNTLVKEWGFLTWDEPLPSSFVFLQSCLALMPEKTQPLFSRGAVAVVGTSTRTYSGSGGAFSLAYFNALLYDGRSLGGSLRQAKNFLLAYAMLKERRLGDQASRLGANQRASWAFSLWGDPTYRLPLPASPSRRLAGVEHEVVGKDIVLHLPGHTHDQVLSERFRVRMPPNGRLAGLIRKTDEETNPVVPMVFAEVPLPEVRPGTTPRLRTRLAPTHWVFLWDARRRTGYVLVTPRSFERGQVRFRVETTGAVASVGGPSPDR